MTMIERVAAAIVIAQQRGLDRNGVARAVVEAMREPTDDMLDAMNDVPVDGGDYTIFVSFADCTELYKAAIDQVLKDEA